MQSDDDTNRDDGPQVADGRRSRDTIWYAAWATGYLSLLPVDLKDRQAEDSIGINQNILRLLTAEFAEPRNLLICKHVKKKCTASEQ
jgi:hypothetical protein